jgi:lipopolysaccharide export system permease protein
MNGLSKYNESIAIRAAGISIFRMVLPLLVVGFIMSIGIALMGEYVMPAAEKERERIYYEDMRKQPREDIKMRGNIFYSDDKYLFYLGFFNGYIENKEQIRIIDVTQVNEHNQILRKIQANEANWNGENWILSETYDRHFQDGKLISYSYHDSIIIPEITVTPLDFIKFTKKPNEMNFFELRDYINRLKKIGEKYHRELTDLYTKISYPFANFIILLFCVPLASASMRSKSRGIIFVFGILISFVYLMILRICQNLGFTGIISPLTAATFPHILFFVVGSFVVMRSEI